MLLAIKGAFIPFWTLSLGCEDSGDLGRARGIGQRRGRGVEASCFVLETDVGKLDVGLASWEKALPGSVMGLGPIGEHLEPGGHRHGQRGEARGVGVMPGEELLSEALVQLVVDGFE